MTPRELSRGVIRQSGQFITELAFVEEFDEETSIFRKLCLLPLEPVWYTFISLIGLANVIAAILTSMWHILNGPEGFHFAELFYFGDMAWTLNITLNIIAKYIPNLKSSQDVFPERRLIWFIVDYIGIIPMELIVPVHVRRYVILTKIRKIFYIFFIFRYVNNKMETSIVTRVFQLASTLLFFIAFAALLFAQIYRLSVNGKRPISEVLYIVADHMTGRGFGLIANEYYVNILLLTISTFCIYFFVVCESTAKITSIFIQATEAKSKIRYKFNALKKHINRQELPEEFMECLNCYFDALWNQACGNEELMGGRRNHTPYRFPQIIPQKFADEICLDISIGIFKHSALLSKLPIHFLRELSTLLSIEVYMENQLLFPIDEIKDRMVYVFNGTVELISDEDGVTPIMQFTAGTVFSEVCLFAPYKSKFMVKCSTNCIFHILRRNDLLQVTRKWPKIMLQLREKAVSRFTDAMSLKRVQKVYNTAADKRSKCSNMWWLVFMMHKLMQMAYPHKIAKPIDYMLGKYINDERFSRHIFCPYYLNSYSINVEAETYDDTLFIKTTFPYIFRPGTGLVTFWDTFIMVCALIAGIHIPYATLLFNTTQQLHVVVHIYTGIWFVDLVVQMRIAEVYQKHLLTNTVDLLIIKLGNIVFVMDVLSIVPLEFFSGVFAYPGHANYIYLNRILKLVRVIRFLKRREAQFNSSPLVVRLISTILFTIYCIFITSCAFFYIELLDPKSRPRFSEVLFYTCQTITAAALWVENYVDMVTFQMINVVLFLCICVIYSVLYGLVFAAYGYAELLDLQKKYNTKNLIHMMKKIHPRYEEYIGNAVSNSIKYNHEYGFDSWKYMFDNFPREWPGYFYELHFQRHINDLPLFQSLCSDVIREIFAIASQISHYTARQVIFHCGELCDHIQLLIHGNCYICDGGTLQKKMMQRVHDLNSPEVLLMIPMRTTVVTITECQLLQINAVKMREVILKHRPAGKFKGPLAGLRALRARILHTPLLDLNLDILEIRTFEIWRESHIHFHRQSPALLDGYHTSGWFHFRWLLMNLSFGPQGRFLYIWEHVRATFAVMSAILFTTVTFIFYEIPHPLGLIKWSLDVLAFIDIYIRCHVCYYNELGILVTHPSRTMKHYATHGLAIDLLGAAPIHILVHTSTYTIMNINKVLQLHRYISLLKYRKESAVTPLRKLFMFVYVPLFVVVINMVASGLLLLNCNIDVEDIANVRITCPKNSLFAIKGQQRFEDPITVHIHALYIVLSIISRVSLQGFQVITPENMLLVGLLSLCGFYFDTLYAAHTFGYCANQYRSLVRKYVKAKHLKRFLQPLQKSKQGIELQHLVDSHISLASVMTNEALHFLVQKFPHNIKRDIMYGCYGPTLIESCLKGSSDIEFFIRNILMHTEYRFFNEQGHVIINNDVCKYTMIIFSGLLAYNPPIEDHSRTESTTVTLGPGTILGNMCPLKFYRIEGTYVAVGAIELLYVKSLKFFDILQEFPNTCSMFRALREIHKSYIPGHSHFRYSRRHSMFHKTHTEHEIRRWYILLNILNFTGSYVPQVAYLIDIIMVNNGMNYANLLWDVCFVAALVVAFKMPLQDPNGGMIPRENRIREFFAIWLFTLSIVSLVPFYLFGWNTITPAVTIFYVQSALRLNVILRIFFFRKIISTTILLKPDLKYLAHFVVYILMTILAILGAAALMMLIANINDVNMSSHIGLEPLIAANMSRKFEHLATYFYITTNVFLHNSQAVHFPLSFVYILLFVVYIPAAMVFNGIFNAILVSIIVNIDENRVRSLGIRNQLVSILERNEASAVIIDRLTHYCGLKWNARMGQEIPMLFKMLPHYLREPISRILFMNIIEKQPIFIEIHSDLRRQMYLFLRMEFYLHGDYITYAGSMDECVFFVMEGHVAGIIEHEGVLEIIEDLYPGAAFGIPQGILPRVAYDYNYRAVSDCNILHLKKQDWQHLWEFFPCSMDIMFTIASVMYNVKKSHID